METDVGIGVNLSRGTAGRRTVLVGALMITTTLGAAFTASPIWAQDTQPSIRLAQLDIKHSFNIPSQSLTTALTLFGQQSGLQITVNGALVRNLTAATVQGSMSHERALSRLLAGTGLTYLLTGGDTIVIQRTGAQTSDGVMHLDPISVVGHRAGDRHASSGSGFQGTPDWVYETPASVSVISRQAIQNMPSRNTRDLLDSVAGVYANRSEAQNPGISVNVRGLQDQGRVATMIDGARQNFQRNAHGATQRTYVESAFIREIDIEKSSSAGVGSAGTLGGSINFRTIIAGDLIEPGKDWGMEVNATTGTNAFEFNGSVATAFKVNDKFTLLGGVSYKSIGAYAVGENGDVYQNTTYTGDTMLFSGQVVASSILKAEISPTNDLDLTIGWTRNKSKFSTGSYDTIFYGGDLRETVQDVTNNTITAALDWNPASPLINLEALIYFNRTNNSETSPPWVSYLTEMEPSSYQMDTFGGSLQNTSRHDTPLGEVTLNIGGEAFHDKGETELNGGQYVLWDNVTNAYIDYSEYLSGGTPSGSRTVAGGFISATLEHEDWLIVEGGLRYDWYNISGNTTIFGITPAQVIGTYVTPIVCAPSPPFPPNVGCRGGETVNIYSDKSTDPYNVQIDNSGSALLPSATIAIQPTDWFQPFVKYSKSFRSPSIMESFINGGHGGMSVSNYAPNPNLKPERAETYEFGVNISHDSLFFPDDAIRLKVVQFYREIEDYISFGVIRNEQNSQVYTSYVNLNGLTEMEGLELEVNYDAGFFYIGGAVTSIKTELADNFTTPGGGTIPINAGVGAAIIFEQPEMRITLDGGVRLFDESLILGMRMNDVGASEPQQGSLQQNHTLEGYRVYDLYGSYAFNDQTKLQVGVNNLTDKAYVSALGATYYAMPGRTITASLNFKF